MATPQESRLYNQNEIYPLAGWEFPSATVVNEATTLNLSQWGISVSTVGGAFTITLPADPYIGKQYQIFDGAPGGSFNANNLTISGNGHTINGSATLVANVNYASFLLRFCGIHWIIVSKS